jgi:poly-gamma-glutamate synthesis protein (capsule biosynthesis protein)
MIRVRFIAVLALLASCAGQNGVAPVGLAGGSPGSPVPVITVPPSATPTATTVPSTTTTVAPPTTTTTVPERRRIVIRGTGDVNLDPEYIPALAANGYDHAWSGLDGLFLTDDITVVNLECAAAPGGSPAYKEFVFQCGDEAALRSLADAGVEVANLGNNHSQDHGTRTMLRSRKALAEVGVSPVGVGKNLRQATRPALFEVGGWTVAVLGFGGVVPEPGWLAGPKRPGMASGDDIPTMVEAVERADEVADLVFVTIHWGTELDAGPRPEDIERAHAMIDAGADGIFGHHQHRLQGLDHYQGRPIAWGLGNFVWPRFSEGSATTAVAEFVVRPDGTVRGKLLPAFIESSGHPVLVGE